MWVAKFVFDASKAVIGSAAIKNKLQIHCYPVSVYRQGSSIRVSFVMVLSHDHAASFNKELKSTGRVTFCSQKGNFIIGQFIEPCKYEMIYNPELMHLKPWIIDGETGTETFVIGSWKRRNLTRISDIIKEKHLGKMLYIKRKEPSDFFMVNMLPKLTSKQRKAIELAIKNGYYFFPRKTNLEDLAKAMHVSYSTFQAHLRKAEHKLIPHLYSWSGGGEN
jgi:predicted DNA binding protein